MSTQRQFAPPPPRLPERDFVPQRSSSPFTTTLLVRLLVTAAFFITLMQYYTTVENAGLIPVFLLYVSGAMALLARDRTEKLLKILDGGAVLFLFLLLSEVVSYYTSQTYSVQYGIILLGLFLAARLIVMQIGFLQIVRCYTYSAITCMLIIAIAGRKQLSDYQGGQTRFTGGSGSHPNLLGFTLAGYLPLFVGLTLDLPRGKKRLFMGCLSLATLVLMFTTGSRGSLGAVILAAVLIVLRFTILNRLIGKLRLSALQVVTVLLGVGAAIYVLMHGTELEKIGKFVVTALQLDSQQRGIHSGFSGRTSIWVNTIHQLSGLDWLFGKGYRAGFVIDNGYITILFDNGIVGGSVILGSMLRVFFWLWRSTSEIISPGWWRYYLALWAMLIIYFVNNITTRYLFSFGNQFSLLVIFMIACNREELLSIARRPAALHGPGGQVEARRARLVSIGQAN
jgi:O-antigen ligase